ncbi:SusD/RagB family nutrient-binding outer membrane lipoprotein [Chitinophaga lutea]
MKAIHKLSFGALALVTMASACTRDFAGLNTSPEVSTGMTPEQLITTSQKAIVDRDFDWFYEHYQYQMRYMQYTVGFPDGNTAGTFTNPRVNDFYPAFYKGIGRNLTEIQRVVGKMSDADKARYAYVAAIASVNKVYAAFRVMDVNGSIPYTEALSARATENVTPVYDNQEKLFATFDEELKAAIATLSQALTDQVSYGNADIFYAGDAKKWAKAANVLRLKIAMRLSKRNPDKVKAIAAEVKASPAGLFTAVAEEWKYVSGNDFARGGNWNAQGSANRGSKKLIDFMYDNQDPRLNLFFKKNAITLEVFNRLKAGGAYPASAVFNPRQYVGMPESPDDFKNPALARLFGTRSYVITEGGKAVTVNYDTLSTYQNRLFDLGSDGNGSGKYTQPIVTYAEMCFIFAELAQRGWLADDAKAWYDKGVTASVKSYDAMAALAVTVDYKAVTDAEIATYLQQPSIAYAGTDAEKLEKIGIQQYINQFKAPWEAWGYYKLLGFPREGGILNRSAFFVNGVKMEVPRRWALPLSNLNTTNRDKAIEEMKATGEYGNAPEDISGRVWWDKK